MDARGNTGATEFWHNGPIGAKVGTICGFTVILIVVVVAHCPAVGVNVYTIVPAATVLIGAFQVPVIAGRLVDASGNMGATEF